VALPLFAVPIRRIEAIQNGACVRAADAVKGWRATNGGVLGPDE